ncbi:MAG: DUF3194 domain-containing protein [Candidatus Jordarchaeales archaeon]
MKEGLADFLKSEDLEEICTLAEQTARRYIFSRCRKKAVRRLNVTVSSEIENGEVTFNVEVDVEVSDLVQVDVNKLIEEAISKAMEKIDERMREIAKRAEGST